MARKSIPVPNFLFICFFLPHIFSTNIERETKHFEQMFAPEKMVFFLEFWVELFSL